MEITNCPGCGAAVQRGASWCSLCYHDLRPSQDQATVPTPRDSSAGQDRSRGPSPVSGPAFGSLAAPTPGGTATSVCWPCECGTLVPIDVSACPACGADFLNELKEIGPGRHRPGENGMMGLLLGRSRAVRMTIAGVFALLVAVAVPIVLTLVS